MTLPVYIHSIILSYHLCIMSYLVWVLSYHVLRGGLSCVIFMHQYVSVFSFVIMCHLSVSLGVHMDRPLFIVTASCVSALHYTDDAVMSLYSSSLCVHCFPIFRFSLHAITGLGINLSWLSPRLKLGTVQPVLVLLLLLALK